MKILICGGGMAGLTLAWWLQRDGHEVRIVERSPGLQAEGYLIDFFGSGWDVVERMGLLDRLAGIHHPVPRFELLRSDGTPRASFTYEQMCSRFFGGRHFNLMHGDLERVLYEALDDRSVVRFGTTVRAIADYGDRLGVVLSDGTEDDHDLLVGADGIHSHIRKLGLTRGEDVVRFLGLYTAAFVISDDGLCTRYGGAFRTMTVPNRQVAICPIREGKLAALFVHTAPVHPEATQGAGEVLRSVYGDLGWVVPDLLARMPSDDEIYYDTVSQVVMEPWSHGRVALCGDACQAVSLIGGASMALGGAVSLAAELRSGGSVFDALARYEGRVRPAIEKRQRAARRLARWVVPSSMWRISLRDLAMGLSMKPGFGRLVRGSISGASLGR